jgi:hypothetical protein
MTQQATEHPHAALQEEIRRAGRRASRMRLWLQALFVVCLGAVPAALLLAGYWGPAGKSALFAWGVWTCLALMAGAFFGWVAVALPLADAYRRGRRAQLAAALSSIASDDRARMLLPLLDDRSEDTRKIAASLIREFGARGELTPAPSPEGTGREPAAARDPGRTGGERWGSMRTSRRERTAPGEAGATMFSGLPRISPPPVGDQEIAAVREQIRDTGHLVRFIRMAIVIPVILFTLGLALFVLAFVTSDHRDSVSAPMKLTLATVLQVAGPILLWGGLIGGCLAFTAAAVVGAIRAGQIRRALAALSPEQQAEALLPLRQEVRGDAGRFVAGLIRELRVPTELTPAVPPAGRGDEPVSAQG